jgi:hypothetical protein
MKLALLVAMLAVAAATDLPVFPEDWTSFVDSEILLNQGGTIEGPKDWVCCDPEAVGQCKIQVENMQVFQMFGYSMNATRIEGGGGTVVSLYSPIWKEVEVDANNDCVSWCPIDQSEAEFDPLTVGKKAVDLGKKVVKGIETEMWWWEELILWIIPMSSNSAFVVPPKTGEKYSTLVRTETILTPFGQKLGTENATYTGFKAGVDKAKLTVGKLSSCKKSDQCGKSGIRNLARLRDGRISEWAEGQMSLISEEARAKYGRK